MKIKRKQVYDYIYRLPITIVIGGCRQDGFNYFNKRIIGDKYPETFSENGADGTTFYQDSKKGVGLWFRKLDYGVVAHEAVHAALIVMGKCGVKPISYLDDEHFTYYVQWIVDEVYKCE